MDSILNSIKQLRHVSLEDDSFDVNIIENINAAFAFLNQVGVGPEEGFFIEDDKATWTDFMPYSVTLRYLAKSFVEKKVQMLFDPPASGAHTTAVQEILKELIWRCQVEGEPTASDSCSCPNCSGKEE